MAGTTGSAPATGGDDAKPPATGDDKGDKAPATGAGTAPATGDGSTDSDDDPEAAPLTPDEIKAMRQSQVAMAEALKKANGEAAKLRRDQAAAEAAKQAAADAELPELEQLRKFKSDAEDERKAWKVERAEMVVEREIGKLVPTLGIVDPEAVTRLLDWDSLEFDEHDKPTNVQDAVEALVKSKPYLVNKQGQQARNTGNNAGDGATGTGPKPNLTAAELEQARTAGMTPEHYGALKGVRTLDDYMKTRRTGAGG